MLQLGEQIERLVETGLQLPDIGTAGLRHVGAASTLAADHGRELSDQLAGVDPTGEVRRNHHHQGRLPLMLSGQGSPTDPAENDAPCTGST